MGHDVNPLTCAPNGPSCWMTGPRMAHALELRQVYPLLTGSTDRPADPVADVRAVAAGDREAFTRVYASYGRMVRAILLGRVRPSDVDDLLQDVFLTAYTRIRELRDPSAFGGWIAAIARNRATDHLRQTRDYAELPPELPGGEIG